MTKLSPLALANLLRHAFMSGYEAAAPSCDLAAAKDWTEYEPPEPLYSQVYIKIYDDDSISNAQLGDLVSVEFTLAEITQMYRQTLIPNVKSVKVTLGVGRKGKDSRLWALVSHVKALL